MKKVTEEERHRAWHNHLQETFRKSSLIKYKRIPSCYGEAMYFYDMVNRGLKISEDPNYYRTIGKKNDGRNEKVWNAFMKDYKPGDEMYIFEYTSTEYLNIYGSGMMLVRNGIAIGMHVCEFA